MENSVEDTWSFEKEFGYEPPRPIGGRVCVMRYVKQFSGVIDSTEETSARSKYESIVGRVVRLGGSCFKGEYFKDWIEEDFFKVGDFVTFRVNPGTWFKYGKEDIFIKRELPKIISLENEAYNTKLIREHAEKKIDRPVLTIIYDEHINGIVEDPGYIERE